MVSTFRASCDAQIWGISSGLGLAQGLGYILYRDLAAASPRRPGTPVQGCQ